MLKMNIDITLQICGAERRGFRYVYRTCSKNYIHLVVSGQGEKLEAQQHCVHHHIGLKNRNL